MTLHEAALASNPDGSTTAVQEGKMSQIAWPQERQALDLERTEGHWE
jgi:hypothetical protein